MNIAKSLASQRDIIKSLFKRIRTVVQHIFLLFHHLPFSIIVFQLLPFQISRKGFNHFTFVLRQNAKHALEVIKRKAGDKYIYRIKETIFSPTAHIYVSYSKRTHIMIYMKICQRCKTEDTDHTIAREAIDNLIEGFYFNRRFARGVYIGLARVEEQSYGVSQIRRWPLMFYPKRDDLEPGKKYAVVMRKLSDSWRLDRQLDAQERSLGTREGMEFLAHQVAQIHKKFTPVPVAEQKSSYASIEEKLAFNSRRLREAVQLLPDADAFGTSIEEIVDQMQQACAFYKKDFEQRQSDGHIRRCHGDLKLTNLWVVPNTLRKSSRTLFALDCIDFKPDFCRIDTLSDVAMLAMDIEAHYIETPLQEERLAQGFLTTYLQTMKENETSLQPLIEFYLTEKAMVCAYVSILFDHAPDLGKRYLAVARLHAEKLGRGLPAAQAFRSA